MPDKILMTEEVSVYYGSRLCVNNISLSIEKNKITSLLGPSGSGKSALLRCLNRIHELDKSVRVEGRITLNDTDIKYYKSGDLRKRVGMIFRNPNPFPTMSIYDNVIAGYSLNGIRLTGSRADETVEKSLRMAGLWEEVSHILHKKGVFVSGGQKQRLCIARALALNPEVLLFDDPSYSLDPISAGHIEELLLKLKKDVTIVVATNNTAQAGRISDNTAFIYLGELVEFNRTDKIFTTPSDKRTEKFLTGKLG